MAPPSPKTPQPRCQICGVGDDGRPMCHFQTGKNDKYLHLHTFCGRIAAISNPPRPEYELLNKAQVRNRFGSNRFVTSALLNVPRSVPVVGDIESSAVASEREVYFLTRDIASFIQSRGEAVGKVASSSVPAAVTSTPSAKPAASLHKVVGSTSIVATGNNSFATPAAAAFPVPSSVAHVGSTASTTAMVVTPVPPLSAKPTSTITYAQPSAPSSAATLKPPTKKKASKPERSKKKKAPPPPPKEKRLKRHRSSCPSKIYDRIHRAKSQTLYLIRQSSTIEPNHPVHGGPFCTFAVLGSTGNVYDVTISKIPSCTCPDHAKGNLCKHILFVLLKVVGLQSQSDYVYQAAFLTTELNEIFQTLQDRRNRVGILANEAVRDRYASLTGKTGTNDEDIKKKEGEEEEDGKVKRKALEDDADCPICFDSMGPSLSNLTFCRGTCGTNFHRQCIKMWTSQQCRGHDDVTCPACRQPWVDESTTGGSAGKKRTVCLDDADEGYTNLGDLQGMSSERDTSTYSDWYNEYGGGGGGGWGYGRKRRGGRRRW